MACTPVSAIANDNSENEGGQEEEVQSKAKVRSNLNSHAH